MTHISKIYSCVSTWHIICDLHGFLGFFSSSFLAKTIPGMCTDFFFSFNQYKWIFNFYLFIYHSQGPSIWACISVISSSFGNILMPSGGSLHRSAISLDTWRMICGERFSTFENWKKLTWREYKSDSTTMLFPGFKTKILQHFNYQLFHLNELKTNDKKRVIKLNLWVCAVKPHYVTKLTKQIESFMDYIRK